MAHRNQLLLLLLAMATTGCGGLFYDTDKEVCLTITLSYAGSSSGTLYVRAVSSQLGLMEVVAADQTGFYFRDERTVTQCVARPEHREDPGTATAWLDVDGSSLQCDQGAPKASGCEPNAADPKATSSFVLPAFGRVSTLKLVLVDP